MKLLNDPTLRQSFDALIESYADLLIGDAAPDAVEKVKLWALYSHIHKTMPALANHWNAAHPDAKAAVRELFEDVKALNEKKRAQQTPTST
jgi:hypothetical protein